MAEGNQEGYPRGRRLNSGIGRPIRPDGDAGGNVGLRQQARESPESPGFIAVEGDGFQQSIGAIVSAAVAELASSQSLDCGKVRRMDFECRGVGFEGVLDSPGTLEGHAKVDARVGVRGQE